MFKQLQSDIQNGNSILVYPNIIKYDYEWIACYNNLININFRKIEIKDEEDIIKNRNWNKC